MRTFYRSKFDPKKYLVTENILVEEKKQKSEETYIVPGVSVRLSNLVEYVSERISQYEEHNLNYYPSGTNSIFPLF